MKKENNIQIFGVIAVMLITKIVIQKIGIENISAQVYTMILVLIGSISVILIYKRQAKSPGGIYIIIICILIVVLFTVGILSMILLKYYPQVVESKTSPFVPIILVLFFLSTIGLMVCSVLYKKYQ